MKTIGIVGSRRRNSRNDYCLIAGALEKEASDQIVRIVSGGCKEGGDRFAEVIARDQGLTITIHHADWRGASGKFAGFARNGKIAADCDVLIACAAFDRSGGTEDAIRKAEALGKRIVLV